ncbi:MAG: helix-turn-helix domain-containing protein, partial [Smithella sp.]|nr:helix-turn-helix domain-containing protein [Smithella sp.]
ERGVLMTKTDVLDCDHLPPSLQVKDRESHRKDRNKLSSVVETQERLLIIDALKESGGNQTKAARILGTTKRIIQYKISKMGLDPKIYRKKNKDISPMP